MSKSKYQYKDPLTSGYKRFELTKKKHNTLFKHRQIKWADKYKYYYNEKEIILHKFVNVKAVLLMTILFPLVVVLGGVINFKEIFNDTKELYRQKERGSFSGDHFQSKTDTYDKIMKIIADN